MSLQPMRWQTRLTTTALALLLAMGGVITLDSSTA